MKRRLLLTLVLTALCLALPCRAELVEPIVPSGGSELVEPVYPSGGSELVEPVYPSGGSELVEPVYPSGGSELVEPVYPSGGSELVEPVYPSGGSELVEPVYPSGGSELVEPVYPSGGSELVEFLTPAPDPMDLVEPVTRVPDSGELVEFLTPAPDPLDLVEFITPAPGGVSQACSFTGYITTDGVNVRSGPGLNYSAYTQVSRGRTIDVTASSREPGGTLWYYGSLSGVSGWVMARYVQSGSSPVDPGHGEVPGHGGVPFSWGYVRLGGTNVRTGPGMQYTSLFQVSQGTGVQLLSSACDSAGTLWYKVSVSGTVGYIRADLVTSSGAPVPVPEYPAADSVSFTGYVTGSTANVRSSPSLSASVITVLVRGQSIPVVGSVYSGGARWYKVAYLPKQYGYVSASLISSGAVLPTAAPTLVPSWPDWGSPASFYGYTNTHAVNVRSYPNGGKIAQLAKGTSVYVSRSVWSGGTLWYYASYSGGSGYIRSDLVSRGSAPSVTKAPSWQEISTSYSGMTIKDKCNIRSGPGYQWDAVDQINYGEQVYAYGLCYDGSGNCWYHISYLSGRNGYILSNLVGAYDAAAIRRHRTVTAAPTAAPRVIYVTPEPVVTPQIIYVTPEPVVTPQVIYVTVTPTPGSFSAYAVQPTAAPAAAGEALNFSGFTASTVQTLPVYSAPSADAWISDGGTASITTSGNIWVAGYEGQWLLVLYQNSLKQTRVGYVNGFSFQGTLPAVPALSFSSTPAVLTSQAVLTDDPLGQTTSILSLNAGTEVTFLSKCYLGSIWAYVETAIGGRPVRGFIPLASLDAVK